MSMFDDSESIVPRPTPEADDALGAPKKGWRERNWEICIGYLERHGSIPDAQSAAARDGITFNTSVWISALGKMLNKRGGSQ